LPIDEYVWLGGRPVVLVRGQLSTTYVRQSDATASCPRNGDAAACGVYFPVTDHIGKPVLMLDAQRKVAGVGEYDPFGHVNRVSLDKESPHPYNPASLSTMTLAEFVQPRQGSMGSSWRGRSRRNMRYLSCSRSMVSTILSAATGAVLVTSVVHAPPGKRRASARPASATAPAVDTPLQLTNSTSASIEIRTTRLLLSGKA
jgi:hypothetical protein